MSAATDTVESLAQRFLTGGADAPKILLQLDVAVAEQGMKRVILPVDAVAPYTAAPDPAIAAAACRVMAASMNAVPIEYLLQNYRPYLSQGLASDVPAVRLLALEQFQRASKDKSAAAVVLSSSLFLELIKAIGDGETAVGLRALNTTFEIANSPEGHAALYGAGRETLDALAARGDSVVALRVLELHVKLAAARPDALVEETLLPLFSAAADYHRDLLQAISGIEVLAELLRVEHGFAFLVQRGIFASIMSALSSPRDSLEAMLLPSVYKVLQTLALCPFVNFVEIEEQHAFIASLVQDVQSPDPTLRTPALVAAAAIASTASGLAAILGSRTPLAPVLQGLCQSADAAVQGDALRAVATTLEGVGDAEAFFASFESTFLPRVLSTAKHPFPDQRLAALSVLLALASHPWGRQVLVDVAGLLEYVTDRRTETTHAGKMAKYTLAQRLLKEPRPTLATHDVIALRTFEVEGPFYVATEAVVAVETEAP